MAGQVLLGLLAEAFLRSALESMVIAKTMDAEGRTAMTPEEEARLKASTDVAAAAARQEGMTL